MMKLSKSTTINEFVTIAQQIHGYVYCGRTAKSTIICNKHGRFCQSPECHLRMKRGCPECVCSKGQLELEQDLREIYDGEILFNDRNIISPFELDIVLPEVKLAIEYHGLYWHSYNRIETSQERNKHLAKLMLANANEYRLLQVYESEYQNNKQIINSIILNILAKSKRIYARKCKVVRLTGQQRKDFFNANHIQGDKTAFVAFGLINGSNIVAAMSFSKHVKYDYEIARFANSMNYSVTGGLSRLLITFCREFNPKSILTYSDRRFFDSSGYQSVGFKHVGYTAPGYRYVKGQQTFSRQAFQKHKLKHKLPIFDQSLSEAENMFLCGYRRIWDCGNHKLVWHANDL